jgi:hypothetical protein
MQAIPLSSSRSDLSPAIKWLSSEA